MNEQAGQELLVAVLSGMGVPEEQFQQVSEQFMQNEEAAVMFQQGLQMIEGGTTVEDVASQMVQALSGDSQGQPKASQPQVAKLGAKLNYIKKITNRCPEGYEMVKFARGGRVCSECQKKKNVVQSIPASEMKKGGAVEEFRKGCKVKSKKKEDGGALNIGPGKSDLLGFKKGLKKDVKK